MFPSRWPSHTNAQLNTFSGIQFPGCISVQLHRQGSASQRCLASPFLSVRSSREPHPAWHLGVLSSLTPTALLLCAAHARPFLFHTRAVAHCLLMTSWQAKGHGSQPGPQTGKECVFLRMKTLFGKKHVPALTISLSKSCWAPSVSKCLHCPLSLPPTSFPDGDWQGHHIWRRGSCMTGVGSRGEANRISRK